MTENNPAGSATGIDLDVNWKNLQHAVRKFGPDLNFNEFIRQYPWAWPIWNEAYRSNTLARATPQHSVTEQTVPTSNDGNEQDAFEAWASGERYDMTTHPLHWLFLNERTYAARQGWKAALDYVSSVRAQPLASTAASEQQPTKAEFGEYARQCAKAGTVPVPFSQFAASEQQAGADDLATTMLRDMLAIQEACGLHTDEYAPGSVIEYIKELEDDTALTHRATTADVECLLDEIKQYREIFKAAASGATTAADQQGDTASARFADWLAREMPAGTVIGNPAWWAPRILRAVVFAQQGAAQAQAGVAYDCRQLGGNCECSFNRCAAMPAPATSGGGNG